MNAKEKFEKLLKDLNLYEFEVFDVDIENKKIDFMLIIDYSKEFLDYENIEFEKYLKEKCFYYYDKAIHTRLSLAPIIRIECKISKDENFKDDDFEFFVSFPNEDLDIKTLDDLKIKFIELTKAFVVRILKDYFALF